MATDLHQASLNGMIDWVRNERKQAPNAPLAVLLQGKQILTDQWDEQRLVDLACVDLMHRRRSGHSARIEEYLADFPRLEQESNQLDLIDAELCVSSELGEHTPIEQYVQRFPELAVRIQELYQLAPGKPLVENDAPSPPEVDEQGSSLALLELTNQPLEIPDWFVAGRLVCSTTGDASDNPYGLGRWLVRGRDATRGTAVALKVLQLPSSLSSDDCDRLLDDCEAATSVKNQCWVAPNVAAIQHQHLCVIRPWVHGRTLQETWTLPVNRSQLMLLASVAQTIASAHRAGTHHGGLHAKNVVVDHNGIARVLDAGSSRDVVSGLPNGELVADDAHRLAELVRSACELWNSPWSKRLADAVKRLTETSTDDRCYSVGEYLVQQADLASFDY